MFFLQEKSPLWAGRFGANPKPEFGAPDDDLLPDISVEHGRALLIYFARSLVDGLEHRSDPISPIRSAARAGFTA